MNEKPIEALRRELQQLELTGFIVPHADEYQNEYVPACAERLAWLTGFTGSAGSAIVLAQEAAGASRALPARNTTSVLGPHSGAAGLARGASAAAK